MLGVALNVPALKETPCDKGMDFCLGQVNTVPVDHTCSLSSHHSLSPPFLLMHECFACHFSLMMVAVYYQTLERQFPIG